MERRGRRERHRGDGWRVKTRGGTAGNGGRGERREGRWRGMEGGEGWREAQGLGDSRAAKPRGTVAMGMDGRGVSCRYFKGADFIIPVKGGSMCPTYHFGDLIACKRVPMGDLFFLWNKAYVLDTKQGPLVKRIELGKYAMLVKIVSDNEMYDPFELPRSAINSVAMVMGIIRLE